MGHFGTHFYNDGSGARTRTYDVNREKRPNLPHLSPPAARGPRLDHHRLTGTQNPLTGARILKAMR
jgi:hypothetical protein